MTSPASRRSVAQAQKDWIADAAVHVVGLMLAPVGVFVLVTTLPGSLPADAVVALAVYAAGIVGMITASAAYNITRPVREDAWLRRIDHAAIFVAIAGTYTPFLWLRLSGTIGTAMSATVWILAIAGAVRCLVRPSSSSLGKTTIYLLLGWIGLPALPMLVEALRPATLGMIAAGGLLYSVGAVIHRMDGLRFHDAIWHVLVLAAAACHLQAMRLEFAGPTLS
jgi:hemolysin III